MGRLGFRIVALSQVTLLFEYFSALVDKMNPLPTLQIILDTQIKQSKDLPKELRRHVNLGSRFPVPKVDLSDEKSINKLSTA
jgi:hypothetical protein